MQEIHYFKIGTGYFFIETGVFMKSGTSIKALLFFEKQQQPGGEASDGLKHSINSHDNFHHQPMCIMHLLVNKLTESVIFFCPCLKRTNNPHIPIQTLYFNPHNGKIFQELYNFSSSPNTLLLKKPQQSRNKCSHLA